VVGAGSAADDNDAAGKEVAAAEGRATGEVGAPDDEGAATGGLTGSGEDEAGG